MRMGTILSLARLCLTALKFTFHFPYEQSNFIEEKKLHKIRLGNGREGLFSNLAHKHMLIKWGFAWGSGGWDLILSLLRPRFNPWWGN